MLVQEKIVLSSAFVFGKVGVNNAHCTNLLTSKFISRSVCDFQLQIAQVDTQEQFAKELFLVIAQISSTIILYKAAI